MNLRILNREPNKYRHIPKGMREDDCKEPLREQSVKESPYYTGNHCRQNNCKDKFFHLPDRINLHKCRNHKRNEQQHTEAQLQLCGLLVNPYQRTHTLLRITQSLL